MFSEGKLITISVALDAHCSAVITLGVLMIPFEFFLPLASHDQHIAAG
jgi:hypothetical protein